MTPLDFNNKRLGFQPVEIILEDDTKIKGLFTELRVKRDSVPDNLHLYSTRHGDDGDWCTPISIEYGVLVNFYGHLITDNSRIDDLLKKSKCGPFSPYLVIKDFYYIDDEDLSNFLKEKNNE